MAPEGDLVAAGQPALPGLLAAPIAPRAGERGPASTAPRVEQVCVHVHLAGRLEMPACPAVPQKLAAAPASHHGGETSLHGRFGLSL